MEKAIVLAGITMSEASWPLLFSEGLAQNGVKVTLISGYANRNFDSKYREFQLAHPVELRGNNLKIIRVGTTKLEKKNLFHRFIRYICLTIDIHKEFKKHNADCVFIYSTPPFLGLLGKKVKKKGRKSIYIAQDLFPDNLFIIKPKIENTIIGKTLRLVEKRIYKSCSSIVTVSQTMKSRILSSGIPADKVMVINNWANVENLKHVLRENNTLFDEYAIDRNSFIVSYAGSLGKLQRIDVLLDVAKELKDYSDLQIVIFGIGECKEKLEERVANEGITNVAMLPMQPKEKIAEVYSFGDLEYVSVSPGVMKMASPHKILDILAVGKPILAAMDKECDMAELIQNKKMGIVVSCDVDEIKSAILDAYLHKNELPKMGENCRKYAETIDYSTQITKYKSLMNI